MAFETHRELMAAVNEARGPDFVPNKKWREIRLHEPPVLEPKRGDMILGYLFGERTLEEFVEGVMSHALPIAGPIFYEVAPDSPWAKYAARCAGCGDTSRFFEEPTNQIMTWARKHRCKVRLELGHVHR